MMQLIITLHVKNRKSDHRVFSTRQANAYTNGVKDGLTPNKNFQIHNAMHSVKTRYQLQKQWLALLVEHPTGKARYNTDVGSSPKCSKGFFSQSQLSVQTLTVSVQPPVRNRMHQHICARYKSQTPAAIPLFGHRKLLHILIGMGSAGNGCALPG